MVILELTGPPSARIAFARSGESRPYLGDELLPLEDVPSNTDLR